MNLNRPTSTVQPKLEPGLDPQPYPIEKGFQDRLPKQIRLWKAPTNPISRATIY